MSKLYVTIDALKERMQIPTDLEGTEGTLTSALRAAQLRIETFLGSKLERGTREDIFFTDSEAYSGIQPSGLFRLYLGNGLLNASPVPTVQISTKWNGDWSTVTASDYKIDYERGLVMVDATPKYRDMYFKVGYTSGYLKASELPGWLSEAILAYAPALLNASHVTNASDKAKPQYNAMIDHSLAIAAPYQRNVGMTLRAIF